MNRLALAFQKQQSPQIKPLNPLNHNLLLGQSPKFQKVLPPSAAGSISAGNPGVNPPPSLFPKFNRRSSQEFDGKRDLSLAPIDVEVKGEPPCAQFITKNPQRRRCVH